MISLTDSERNKFAEYLDHEAIGNEGLAKQMEKLPGPMTLEIAKRYRAEAAAMLLIASRLRNTEAQNVMP